MVRPLRVSPVDDVPVGQPFFTCRATDPPEHSSSVDPPRARAIQISLAAFRRALAASATTGSAAPLVAAARVGPAFAPVVVAGADFAVADFGGADVRGAACAGPVLAAPFTGVFLAAPLVPFPFSEP